MQQQPCDVLARMAVEADARPPEPSGSLPLHGTERILVVEDEPAVRHVVARMLENSGYTVLEAPAGAEALALAGALSDPPHVVVTDEVMPKMSGRELVAALRELWPTVRVVLMSGYPERAVAGSAGLGPGIVFLEKPFRPIQLGLKVREALAAPMD